MRYCKKHRVVAWMGAAGFQVAFQHVLRSVCGQVHVGTVSAATAFAMGLVYCKDGGLVSLAVARFLHARISYPPLFLQASLPLLRCQCTMVVHQMAACALVQSRVCRCCRVASREHLTRTMGNGTGGCFPKSIRLLLCHEVVAAVWMLARPALVAISKNGCKVRAPAALQQTVPIH